eukprot:6092930-Prymnesium_polylepis.1
MYSWVVVVPNLRASSWAPTLDAFPATWRIEFAAKGVGLDLRAAGEAHGAHGRLLKNRGGGAAAEADAQNEFLRTEYRMMLNERVGTPEVLLMLWTFALVLDEWSQWVLKPSSFHVDMWNQYDYIVLGITTVALGLRVAYMLMGLDEDEHYVDTHNVLAMNNLLVWCRLLQYLSMSQNVGVLIIM